MKRGITMNSEKPNIENEPANSAANEGPWGDSYQNDLPPFNSNRSEVLSHRSISIDALISDGDEEIARCAQAIDNCSLSIPGQEENVANRRERLKADYKRARELRDAEKTVLDSIRDDNDENTNRGFYKREDIIDRIREYQASISSEKDWLQLNQASSRLIKRLEKLDPDLAGDLSSDDMEYWEKITNGVNPVAPEKLVPNTVSKEELAQLIGAETPEQQPDEEPISYHISGGIVDKDTTISVGQEIPDEWFQAKTTGESDSSGFGVHFTQTPKIENYLVEVLNTEFGKLSEAERQQYSYPDLVKTVKEEARRTKKVPDIAKIINQAK